MVSCWIWNPYIFSLFSCFKISMQCYPFLRCNSHLHWFRNSELLAVLWAKVHIFSKNQLISIIKKKKYTWVSFHSVRMTSLQVNANLQSVDIPYLLFTQWKIAAFIPQGGRLILPMPSRRVAGCTSGQVFCELKIILWNCYKRVLFSSTVRRIYVKL